MDGAAVVIENGSRYIRAGFAGSQTPLVSPNVIARSRPNCKSTSTETLFGHDAFDQQGTHSRKYPIEWGVITNWEDMEKVWYHTFHTELGIDPTNHPMLHTEPPMNPKANREKLTQIMFESFNVPALYLAAHPVLALLAAARSTGCVFESGGGMAHVVPIYEGHIVRHVVQKYMISGDEVTDSLTKLLLEKGIKAETTADREIVRQVKEKMCYVSTDPDQELTTNKGLSDVDSGFSLPSGQVVSLGSERFMAPEVIFKPQLIGIEYRGAPDTIYHGIRRCHTDLHEEMLRNVCLSGGNTMFPGLRERLKSELCTLALQHNIEVISAEDRATAAWYGGSLLASREDFISALCISKEEYDEHGPRMAHIKCF